MTGKDFNKNLEISLTKASERIPSVGPLLRHLGTLPVGCDKSPFRPRFGPLGATWWTFLGGNGQTTQWESFSWTCSGIIVRLFRYPDLESGAVFNTGGFRLFSGFLM